MKIGRLIAVSSICLISIYSCKKEINCTDPLALNDNSESQCEYSIVTFYASGNTFKGEEVSEIFVTIPTNGDTLGIINTFNQTTPTTCDAPGNLRYCIFSGTKHVWFARYTIVSGGSATAQGEFYPSNSESCIKIDVLP